MLNDMPQVVLVGKDWKTRALVRAQLREEGLDAEAFETVDKAREAVEVSYPQPRLLVADLSGSVQAGLEVRQLAQWSGEVPVWIIASRGTTAESDLEGRGFEQVWFKPINVGQLVIEIKRRVQSSGGARPTA